MDKVQHFEIPVDDMGRAKEFYGKVFNWQLTDVPGMDYTMAYTTEVDEKFMPKEVGVINGGLAKRVPIAPHPTIAITVESCEAALKKIADAGGTVLSQPQPVGDMGIYAHARDTEGNVIGIWQNLK